MKRVTIKIDDVDYQVEASKTVLQVALENQIQVPYFCYHPYLSVPGNCRQCQVKTGSTQEDGSIRWMPKLQVSCNTQVAPGMVVDTRCEEVRQAQAANMEFLLINHPLDCPICDQVGECWLQEHAFTAGPGNTRFRENKVHFDKRVDVGPHVLLDKERCIQCTRCIRFCDEVTGTSELALFSRADRTEVDIFPGRPLNNPYSGNVVDICPVGALTLKEFRFKSRLWFLKTESSVCPGCARGCNVKVWHRDSGIARITPRDNPEVNKSWMCDYGRLLREGSSGERVREPRTAAVGGHDPAGGPRPSGFSWEQALQEALTVLQEGGGMATVIHSRATLEEAYLSLLLTEKLSGGVSVAVPAHQEGEDDDLLLRRDRTANRRGVLELLAGTAPGLMALEEMLQKARAGEIKSLLVVGDDLFEAGVESGLVTGALDAGLRLVVLASHESRTTERGAVVLPAGLFPEVDGTVVNFRGRVQAMRAAYAPPFLARTGFWILSRLATAAGVAKLPSRPRDLFDRIGAEVGAFHGLDFDSLGNGGAWLPAAATKTT